MSAERVDPVVIVGAGPTGITAAMLLAQQGVESLVLDRWEGVYPLPRAVHLDDEVYRILARLGLGEQFAAISRPCHGLRLVDAGHRVLAEFVRSDHAGVHGFPQANMFDQPELEALLRANLDRFPAVTLRSNVEVTGVEQDSADHARVLLTDLANDQAEVIRAGYVLGCDGARSIVRASIGATMVDLGFEQRWLVVDIDSAVALDAWDGVQQVCDTARAATFMPVRGNRYRWEFRLLEGEDPQDYGTVAALQPLLAPWTRGVGLDQLALVRVGEYTFRAQLADRWRDRRVFILGDAAHLTPPFIGQGMGAGVRDAANLAWKLAGVLHGTVPGGVLDTYEAERKPHAGALIRRAMGVGMAMTSGGQVGDALRRVIAPRLRLIPGLRTMAIDSTTPRLRCVASPLERLPRGMAGRLSPNAALPDGRRLDDLIAGRFALVTRMECPPDVRDDLEARGAVVVNVPPTSALAHWLRRGLARAAVVRPDGTVARAGRDLRALSTALPRAAGRGEVAAAIEVRPALPEFPISKPDEPALRAVAHSISSGGMTR